MGPAYATVDTERVTPFTTGANEAGYGLASVTLQLRRAIRTVGNPVPEVSIYSDSNGRPGGSLVTFVNPSNISSMSDSVADYTFTAPQPSPGLSPNTTYWIKLYSIGAAIQVNETNDFGQNTGNQDDWSIGDYAVRRTRGSSSAYTVDDYVLRMTLGGVLLSPTQAEPIAWDFPYSDQTWGYIETNFNASGRVDATLDSGRRTGDWWKLRVEPHRRYRVQVQFGSGSSQATGGGIDVNYNNAWWDHNRDDGLAFIEFTTISEPYYLRVRARDFLRDFLNEGSATYHGPYTVNLTDITGITRKVSNTRANTAVTKAEVSNTLWKASSFTTGSNTGGYKLSYVRTGLHNKTGASSVRAELWTHERRRRSQHEDLRLPTGIGAITGHPTAYSTPTGSGLPATQQNLAADTTYWVVFKDMNSGSTYEVTSGLDSALRQPRRRQRLELSGHHTLGYDTSRDLHRLVHGAHAQQSHRARNLRVQRGDDDDDERLASGRFHGPAAPVGHRGRLHPDAGLRRAAGR